ncbi:hypothetical protein BCR34DRAFT_569456 [Clohesyomyces aquaticus]|uniref:Tyrosinase copper-binding domain-containing protein n=1 Tax=Clohesyomyces aquaticus TaxID=1231657 RepID=A0A1Y1ZEP1_9PLEO|nr:hypothetical protein BCR34DRAFT_569456 [Clohesyomyces aquaticus]
MRLVNTLYLLGVAGTVSHALPQAPLPTAPAQDVDAAAAQLEQLASYAQSVTDDTLGDANTYQKRGACTAKNLAIRREWGSLSSSERKAYIAAVKCLQKKPAKTPSSLFPGAKSRFDDWVATHISQTPTIHYTGTFLAWHRYFTWQYEQALRNECGYTGYQPYWNWGLTAQTGFEKSPIFDGSDTSMSGNGEFVPNQGEVNLGGNGLPDLYLPHGTGGGCVKSGPFKDMSVNLGPVQLGLTNGSTVSNGDGKGYNPRCLKRDLTLEINKRFANMTSIVSLILQNNNIEDFQMKMQGIPGSGAIGVHGGGHYTMGGDPGRDLFTSPGEPLFWLHHSGIDRTWWIWQQLDCKTRTSAQGISGTGTFLNQPPSPDTTLDTPIDLGYAVGPAVTMRDLMSTTDGPFCYVYL